jgi:hypothetical protein
LFFQNVTVCLLEITAKTSFSYKNRLPRLQKTVKKPLAMRLTAVLFVKNPAGRRYEMKWFFQGKTVFLVMSRMIIDSPT